jgi:DNA repair exonuclease SbcCD nuclease subunit
MPGRPFRFVHAGDFHLEMPLQGVIEVPDHLRDAFCEAPFAAAQRVFDAAVAEEAEMVVLSGNLVHPGRAGVRGPLFLAEQFARLAEQGIAVYWAGGEVDPPEAWPAAFPLGANVHVFPRGKVGELVHSRDDVPLVRLVGESRDGQRPFRPGQYQADPGGLATIAVVPGSVEAAAIAARGIHYWALGGRHDRATLLQSPTVAHWPGSPQGRRPEHSGAHGCTLVQVDEQGHARTSFLPTDAIRWLDEPVDVDEHTGREDLDGRLRQRVQALLETTPKLDLLISWTIAGSGPLLAELRRGSLGPELLGRLRSEYGLASPAAWSVSLEVEPAGPLPEALYEQQTILGDFLRAVRQYEMNPGESLGLEAYMAEPHLAGALAAAASVADTSARQRVLHDAALLAAHLLGEEAAT